MTKVSSDPPTPDPDGPVRDLEAEAASGSEADRRAMQRQLAEHAARSQAEDHLGRLSYAWQAEPSQPPNAEPFPAIVGALAARGWAIFPLDGKIPFKGSHGFKDATKDLAQLRLAW